MENHIATAADFARLIKSSDLYGEPERVVLLAASALQGSEFAVILRRPKPICWALKLGMLPNAEPPQESEPYVPAAEFEDPYQTEQKEQLSRVEKALDEIFMGMFVKPKLVRNPQGPDEVPLVYLTVLPKEDLKFLLAWSKGMASSDGTGYEAFFRKFGPDADAGNDGIEVRSEAESVFVG